MKAERRSGRKGTDPDSHARRCRECMRRLPCSRCPGILPREGRPSWSPIVFGLAGRCSSASPGVPGPASGDFKPGLAGLASKNVVMPRIDAESRRERDHVRVTLAMTIAAADVAEAPASFLRVLQETAIGDLQGWDMTSASAPRFGPRMNRGSNRRKRLVTERRRHPIRPRPAD
jgi:hypothetical protein